jgi:hypothetical protein
MSSETNSLMTSLHVIIKFLHVYVNLTAKIEKNKARDGSITAEIERILTDV